MESIDFNQRNKIIGGDQPQYVPLYAHVDELRPERPCTWCMQLTPEEIDEIACTGKIWLTQWTFNNQFAPMQMTVFNPFTVTIGPASLEAAYPVTYVAITVLLVDHGFVLYEDGSMRNGNLVLPFNLLSSYKTVMDFQIVHLDTLTK